MKTAEENRVANSRKLAATVGSLANFSDKIDRSATQASRFMGKNPTTIIGPKMARHIETCFGKPEGWLDVDHSHTFDFNDIFAKRLNAACDRAEIPIRGRARYFQDRLSEKITIVAIRRWFLGESTPDTKRLPEVALIASTTVENLLGLEAVSHSHQEIVTIHRIPVIQWKDIEDFCNFGTKAVEPIEELYYPKSNISLKTFALKVIGDTMSSPHGKSFIEGDIIFVDPQIVPKVGMRVIAKIKKGFTFRELAHDELGQKYLKPLNSHHQPIFEESLDIQGVVIGSFYFEPPYSLK
ncbi:LexA family transcriptional regulator [Photobacterium sp. TLY01]|uniref:LexA family protein n=1 Tax=Photobacterium sp. TLY01 TaxID=2907534 RepID=UPI001F45A3ED|nr:S24 family peptidase [Photobacterium sp. TLY01]UIP28860.1 S24 family peptidase [Photobacterium sp. TLY01]